MLKPCALAVLVMLAVAPVSAVVVDNFEEGPFSISGDTTTGFGIQSPLMAANAIDDTREVSIQSGAAGQFATAVLTLSAGDDALVATLPASGGTLSLIYRPVPTDLTEGGSADRIVFEIDAAPTGAAIILTLEDAIGGSQAVSPPFPGPGSFSILLSDVPDVDPTQVDFVRLIFTGTGAGSWEIRDVRSTQLPPSIPALSAPAAVALTALLAGFVLLGRQKRRGIVR